MRFYLTFLILILVSGVPIPAQAQQSCTIPLQYMHAVSQIEESVKVTVATERETYSVGDSIACYLMLENIGDSTYAIPNPSSITPLHSFWILPDSCDSLEQEGCTENLLFLVPTFVFFFGTSVILDPGECVKYEATWSGTPFHVGSTLPGSYSVVVGMTTGSWIFFLDGGVRLPITIQDLVPGLASTWGHASASTETINDKPYGGFNA